MLILGIAICLLLLAGGSPIFVAFSIGGAIGILYYLGLPLQSVSQYFYSVLGSYTLLAVPFFILAGNIMGRGGIAKALVDVTSTTVGRFPGGMGIGLTVATAMFAAISGSNLATGMAIGSTVVPLMAEHGYPKRFGAALTCASAPLGCLIPPSIVAIIFAYIAELPTGHLFMAGLLPGLALTVMLCITTIIVSSRRKYAQALSVTWGQTIRSILRAVPAGLMPLVVLGGIYGGIFTPTEAAIVSVPIAMSAAILFYREMSFKAFWEVLSQSAKTAGSIYFIIGATCLVGMLLMCAQVPQAFTVAVLGWGLTPLSFLLLSAFILFVLGFVLEANVLVLVVVPLLIPSIHALGVNPFVFYVLLTMMVGIGQLTPPVAIVLYAVSSVVKEPVDKVVIEIVPWFITLLVATVIFILFPILSTFIPSLM